MTTDISTVDTLLSQLIDCWCERRALRPLGTILSCYPRVSGLTDEWALLATSLKTIRFQFANDLEPSELDRVVELQHFAESAVYR